MASQHKSTDVDGLSLVRAIRHAQADGPRVRPAATPSTAPPVTAPPPSEDKPAARFSRTAMPTKQDIYCYSCGYVFPTTGKLPKLFCPKCRTLLEQGDHVLEGSVAGPVETTGTIRVAAGAVLTSGMLVARDIVLEGRVEGGGLKAYRWLEIGAEAVFDQDLVSGQDLRVAAGARVKFKGRMLFRNLEVAGELHANVVASGHVTVRPGGHFRGRLQGAHLSVEEGGGLTAELHVAQPEPAAAGRKKP